MKIKVDRKEKKEVAQIGNWSFVYLGTKKHVFWTDDVMEKHLLNSEKSNSSVDYYY